MGIARASQNRGGPHPCLISAAACALILLALLPILGIFNFAIYRNEAILGKGEILLLELAPADPRSLMQGDYMRLRYTLVSEASTALKDNKPQTGFGYKVQIVVRRDDQGKVRFTRLHKGGTLAKNERLLPLKNEGSPDRPAWRLDPNAFFFQEGQAKSYQRARYAILRMNRSGNYLLAGLADESATTMGLETSPPANLEE